MGDSNKHLKKTYRGCEKKVKNNYGKDNDMSDNETNNYTGNNTTDVEMSGNVKDGEAMKKNLEKQETKNENKRTEGDFLEKSTGKNTNDVTVEAIGESINKKVKLISDDIYDCAETLKNQLPNKVDEKLAGRFRNLNNGFNLVNSNIERVNREICNKIDENSVLPVQRVVDNSAKNLQNNLQEFRKEATAQVDRLQKTINKLPGNIEERIQVVFGEQVSPIKREVKSVADDIGTIVGKTSGLVDDITAIRTAMESKDFTIRTKLPVVTRDEEAFAQMGEYAHNLIEQLTLGAVWYARVREEIEAIAKERANYQEKIKEAREEALQDGRNQGREQLVLELLRKIDNPNGLMSATEGLESVIASVLKNEGVEGLQQVGQEIEIDKEKLSSLEATISIPNPEEALKQGAIKIVSAGVLFNGSILAKAECIPCLSAKNKAVNELYQKSLEKVQAEKAEEQPEEAVRQPDKEENTNDTVGQGQSIKDDDLQPKDDKASSTENKMLD